MFVLLSVLVREAYFFQWVVAMAETYSESMYLAEVTVVVESFILTYPHLKLRKQCRREQKEKCKS